MVKLVIAYQVLKSWAEKSAQRQYEYRQNVSDSSALGVIFAYVFLWPIHIGRVIGLPWWILLLALPWVLLIGLLIFPIYILVGIIYCVFAFSVNYRPDYGDYYYGPEEVIYRDRYIYVIDQRGEAPLEIKEAR